jgi:RNA polymerase-binding transcription factor
MAKTKAVTDRVTDRERYQVLKSMLEDRRREIQDKLRSLRETLPTDATTVKDAEEQSVDDFVQEMDFALMEMKAESLGKIDEAIRRLEAGVYGECAECSTEIAEARLKALPFATLCVACQAREENEQAVVREGGRLHEPAPLR